MKAVMLVVWFLGVAIAAFSTNAHGPIIAGLFILPLFFIGKPWYSNFKKPVLQGRK